MQPHVRTGIPVPRLIACLRHYTWQTFASDAVVAKSILNRQLVGIRSLLGQLRGLTLV